MRRLFRGYLYKEIEIEVYYIDGGEDWFSMVLTCIKSRLKRKSLFLTKILNEELLCDAVSDIDSVFIIENHLRENMIETTGTDNFFRHKIKFKKGYDSRMPWLFNDYYRDRVSKLKKQFTEKGFVV